jgi:hypothetical protein
VLVFLLSQTQANLNETPEKIIGSRISQKRPLSLKSKPLIKKRLSIQDRVRQDLIDAINANSIDGKIGT